MRLDPRVLRTALLWLALFVTVFVTAGAVLLESGVLTQTIVAEVNRRLESQGLVCEAQSITWRPWSGLVIADVRLHSGVAPAAAPSVASDVAPDIAPNSASFGERSPGPMVSVDRVEVGYRFSEVVFGRPRIGRVKVIRPEVELNRLLEWNARVSPARAAAPESTPAPALPSLEIRDLRLLEGRIQAGDELVLSGLRLTGTLTGEGGEWRLRVEEAATRVRTDRIDESVVLTGDVAVESGVINLTGLHLEAAGGRLSFDGHLDPRGVHESSLLATGFAIPLSRIGEWIGLEHPLLLADLQLSCLATGRPDAVRLSGEVRGVGADGIEREIHFSGTRSGPRLQMDTFHMRAGTSQVEMQGEFVFGEETAVEGVAIFRNVEPALALADPDLAIVSGVDGAIRFSGTGLTRATFVGEADLRLSRLSLFGFGLEEGSARITFDRGEVVLENARFERGGSYLEGIGTIDADNRVAAELTGEIVDLADLGDAGGRLSGIELKGKARAEARVIGPLAAPSFEGTLEFARASVFGVAARRLEISLESERLGDSPIAISATGAGLGYGAHAISSATASGEYLDGSLVVRRLHLRSHQRGELLLAGDLDVVGGGTLNGRVNLFEIRSSDGAVRWTNDGPIRVERTPRSLTFSGLRLGDGKGSIEGDVLLHESGDAYVRAAGHGVDLAVFSPFLLLEKPLEGVLRFEADVLIGADTLLADLDFDLANGAWGDMSLDEVDGAVRLRDDHVLFDGLIFRSALVTASLDGRIDLPDDSFRRALADSLARASILDRMVFHDLQAHLESTNFDWLWNRIRQLPAMGGEGAVTIRADGPLLRPTAVMQAELRGAKLERREMDWVSATATYDGERLSVTEGVLRSGPIGVDVGGSIPLTWSFATPVPKCPPDEPFGLRIRAHDFPIGELEAFVELFAALRGEADADLVLVGTTGDLSFEGGFELRNTILTLPVFRDPLVGGRITGRFDREGIEIVDGSFEGGPQGSITGQGRLDLANFRPAGYDVAIRADRFEYHGVENGIFATGSGNLQIGTAILSDGRLVPNFTGRFDVLRADLDERLIRPRDGILEMPEGVQAPEGEGSDVVEEYRTTLLAELRLVAERNVWLRTTEIEAEGRVDITFRVAEDHMGIVGSASAIKANYRVFNTRFDVRKADIEFTDSRDIGASFLDAEAETRVVDEDVTVLVAGPIINPTIELSTETGMTQEEIYELLALRIKRDPLGQNDDEGVINNALRQSYIAALGSRFGRELSRELGLDTFDVDKGDPGYVSAVTAGKTIGRDFYVQYRQNVGTDDEDDTQSKFDSPEQSLVLEYYLNRVFTLQGEAGTIQGDQYLNVDLLAEWGY